LPLNTRQNGPLDGEITSEEIETATYILKPDKSPGIDNIPNEMISCLLEINPGIIAKLFNSILQNPITRNRWNTSAITPIHKKSQTQIIIGVYHFYLAYPNSSAQF